jgi:MFS family permease
MIVGPRYRLRMSQALFAGWLSAAFVMGHFSTLHVEVEGGWVGWRWIAFAVCVILPPLWARWVWENAPHRRAKRARLAARADGDGPPAPR